MPPSLFIVHPVGCDSVNLILALREVGMDPDVQISEGVGAPADFDVDPNTEIRVELTLGDPEHGEIPRVTWRNATGSTRGTFVYDPKRPTEAARTLISHFPELRGELPAGKHYPADSQPAGSPGDALNTRTFMLEQREHLRPGPEREAIIAEALAKIGLAGDTPIKIVRQVTYEGTAETVAGTLMFGSAQLGPRFPHGARRNGQGFRLTVELLSSEKIDALPVRPADVRPGEPT